MHCPQCQSVLTSMNSTTGTMMHERWTCPECEYTAELHEDDRGFYYWFEFGSAVSPQHHPNPVTANIWACYA